MLERLGCCCIYSTCTYGFYLGYESEKDAPVLPLFCYTAVGWHDNKFYVPAVRIEQDIRQECAGYDQEK
jgi:hypothetical protein